MYAQTHVLWNENVNAHGHGHGIIDLLLNPMYVCMYIHTHKQRYACIYTHNMHYWFQGWTVQISGTKAGKKAGEKAGNRDLNLTCALRMMP